MPFPPTKPQLRIRLMHGRAIAVGPGKADLLAAIAATGSIAAAGRAMGMSYKRAWYLIDTMNHCFREPLVHASKGGKGHGGAKLTAMGDQVLALYRAISAQAEATPEMARFAALLSGADLNNTDPGHCPTVRI